MTTPAHIQEIPLDCIIYPAWNSRETDHADRDKLRQLGESIRRDGLQSPIQVQEPDEKGYYKLVFGWRRVEASKLQDLKTIRAQIVPKMTDQQAAVANVVENMVRADLTTYEQARSCAHLETCGLKQAEIGQLVGLSRQSVSNYCTMWNKLAPPIKEEWQGNHPAATFTKLRELAGEKDPETQVRAWDKHVAETAAKDGRADKGSKRSEKKKDEGGGVGIRALSPRLNTAVDILSDRSTPQSLGTNAEVCATKKWAKAFLNWLIGQTEEPPPGFVLDDEEDAEEPETKPKKSKK